MLVGKVAIITGAGSGMGQSMAELFADEGASVVITDINAEALNKAVEGIKAKGLKAIGIVADVSSKDDTKKVFETTLAEFGGLDILINNAGIGEQNLIEETTDELMEQVMNVNLNAPMRYIREALKIFLPKDDGVIINITSVNGTRPFCGASYTASKGALNTLTLNVAMRLSGTNIRCNAVAPGSTVTPMHLANQKGEHPGGKKMLEHSKHYVYFPGPECDSMDQAYACLYLASKMGKAVRGQVIQVCNGAFL
jgi:NAD(P)-dependent dehydrogenase (short-subunit alcohol dehydrogenase family)